MKMNGQTVNHAKILIPVKYYFCYFMESENLRILRKKSSGFIVFCMDGM